MLQLFELVDGTYAAASSAATYLHPANAAAPLLCSRGAQFLRQVNPL